VTITAKGQAKWKKVDRAMNMRRKKDGFGELRIKSGQ
jgi:hypothetical protein